MRQWLFILPIAVGVIAMACGGGASDGKTSATPTSPSGAAAVGAGTPTPEPPAIAKPTPPLDPGAGPIFEVSALQEKFAPTFAEFKELPKTEITVNGKKYSGVSLASLGAKVKSVPSANVTVQGYRPDFKRISFFRYPIADVGSETVLIVDSEGFVSIVSAKIPEAEWLRSVITVAFP